MNTKKNTKEIAGEIFDLSITSYNNKFGRQKYKYGLEYGISIPIDYYLNELNKIIYDSIDAKFYKRSLRYNILLTCINYDEEINNKEKDIINNKEKDIINNKEKDIINPFSSIFKILTNYLNGGNGIENIYNNNILFVVSGGNILTCYFYIIKSIINNNTSNNTSNIINLFTNELYTNLHNTLNKYIEIIKKYSYPDLIKLLDDVKISFSDLDFSLIPNKKSLINKSLSGGTNGTRKSTRAIILKELRDKKNEEELIQKKLEEEKKEEKLKKRRETLKLKKEKDKVKNKVKNKTQQIEKDKLKNKTQQIEKIITKHKYDILYKNKSSEQGFFLFRIKSAFKLYDYNINSDNINLIRLVKSLEKELTDFYEIQNNIYNIKKKLFELLPNDILIENNIKNVSDINLCNIYNFNVYQNLQQLPNNIKKNLNKHLIFNLLDIKKDKFIPHMYSDSWDYQLKIYINELNNIKINKDNEKLINSLRNNLTECHELIKSFKHKKNIIKLGTDINTEILINLFNNSEKNNLYNKIEGLMTYLNKMSFLVNTHITELLKDKNYNDFNELKTNFSTLENITHENSILKYLGENIIIFLLKNNKNIINNLNDFFIDKIQRNIISTGININKYLNNNQINEIQNIKILANKFITEKELTNYDPDENMDIENEIDKLMQTQQLTKKEIEEIEHMMHSASSSKSKSKSFMSID